MSVKNTGIVRFSLDPRRPPKLDPVAKKRLARLPERSIDVSDIPATQGVPWTRPGALVPTENKRQVTLRIDADVLEFFKETGRRYQTRINQVLRSYMSIHQNTAPKKVRAR